MAKFRRKPLVIEAEQFNKEFRIKYYGTAHTTGLHFFDEHLIVHTPMGDVRAEPGDWLVREADGRLYPVRRDIFERTFEPVDE
jgi:hypothetical protein